MCLDSRFYKFAFALKGLDGGGGFDETNFAGNSFLDINLGEHESRDPTKRNEYEHFFYRSRHANQQACFFLLQFLLFSPEFIHVHNKSSSIKHVIWFLHTFRLLADPLLASACLELHVLVDRRFLVVYGAIILVIQIGIHAIKLVKVRRFQRLNSGEMKERERERVIK